MPQRVAGTVDSNYAVVGDGAVAALIVQNEEPIREALDIGTGGDFHVAGSTAVDERNLGFFEGVVAPLQFVEDFSWAVRAAASCSYSYASTMR